MTEHPLNCETCTKPHKVPDGLSRHPHPERDLIVALFRRIGEQPELKDEWSRLPNSERSVMAGDFYNIITSHTTPATERVEIPHYCFGIARDDSGEDDVCENCAANSQCMAVSDLLNEKISERDKVLKGLAGRMRIYEHELQEKYNKTDNIISFTEVETVKKTFEWIDKQVVELRTPTPEAQP